MEGGSNPYVYTGSNPVMNVDSSGLTFQELSEQALRAPNIGMPSIPEPIYQALMGAANSASFGLAQPFSDWANGYPTANMDSSAYKIGEYGSAFTGLGGIAVSGTKTLAKSAISSASSVMNSTKFITPEWSVTVGRWMSVNEYETMKLGNNVLEGAGGLTFVTQGGPKIFPSAAKGSVYVEFSLPQNSLLKGGVDGWYKAVGPNAAKSQQYMIQKQGGVLLPPYKDLTSILHRK